MVISTTVLHMCGVFFPCLPLPAPQMHCCVTGHQQSESTNSGLGKEEQLVSDCIVKPASLQTLPAAGSRVCSQKKQLHLPRHQSMAPGQLMQLLLLM